ncbi:methyltransferase domain-containing protein [Plantactinospora siamensis]|uniref:Methyltransferase domain-containing protein n=1 Tax=Plantactinospora siamensis TaxID=555372 RepID=A0ABV6P0Z4_9ACTN
MTVSGTLNSAGPDPIGYMDAAARTSVGADYKRRLVEALAVEPGHTALDLGCGPGTDLDRLADAVGPTGRVLGVDPDPAMLAEARRRLTARPTVRLCHGDGHALPLADGSVERAKVDRVLQHLAAPGRAVAELRRVVRPGGLFGMAEPDWDTLAVSHPDVAFSRTFARFVAGQVRNPTIGRQLVRLVVDCGARVRSVTPVAVAFADFDEGDQILGLRRNVARAIEAGVLARAAAERWLADLAAGPFLAGFTFYLVIAESV